MHKACPSGSPFGLAGLGLADGTNGVCSPGVASLQGWCLGCLTLQEWEGRGGPDLWGSAPGAVAWGLSGANPVGREQSRAK